ncbi:RDD family protein [uncultured Bosea sp.]|uniref:RDD family protein n=1 Tax=uncultured Bosea sp. TaxID=211457 RepID=UPI0025D381E8|nr:RDD family protein [uncultured Bosea sp.]
MQGTEKLWYWRRHLAIGLDFLPFALILVVLTVLFFGGNSDRVRLDGFGVSVSRCGPGKMDQSVLDAGNAMMSGVVWNQAAFCDISAFGIASNRIVHLARVEKGADNITRTVSVKVPVDDGGRSVSPFYLDWIGYLAFVAAIVGFQATRWQATPAMRLLRIRLVANNGEPAGVKRSFLRLIYAALLSLAVTAVFFGPLWLIVAGGYSPWLMLPALLIALTLYLSWWCPFALKRSLPRAPLHDVWAGTRIVRVAPPSA